LPFITLPAHRGWRKVKRNERLMSRFVSPQKLLVGIAIVSSLGIVHALGAQPHMDAALALLQNVRAAVAFAR
jgi:hypothetical protein